MLRNHSLPAKSRKQDTSRSLCPSRIGEYEDLSSRVQAFLNRDKRAVDSVVSPRSTHISQFNNLLNSEKKLYLNDTLERDMNSVNQNMGFDNSKVYVPLSELQQFANKENHPKYEEEFALNLAKPKGSFYQKMRSNMHPCDKKTRNWMDAYVNNSDIPLRDISNYPPGFENTYQSVCLYVILKFKYRKE